MAKLSPRRVKTDLGHRVRELREIVGLVQEELAEAVGLSTRQLQRVEAGDLNPTLDTLIALANALKTDLPGLLSAPQRRALRRAGRPRRFSQSG